LVADPSTGQLGEPLKAFLGYHEDDLASMRMDFKRNELDRATVPKYIYNILLKDAMNLEDLERRAAAVAPAVPAASKHLAYVPTLNSLDLSSHAIPDAIFSLAVQLSEVFYETMRQGLVMPVHWFRTDHLHKVLLMDASLPRKTHLSSSVSAAGCQSLKIDVLDVEKLKVEWGDDAKSSCVTTYTLVQSLTNMLECIRHLSKAAEADGTSPFIEFKSNVDAVTSIKDLEQNLGAIYDCERTQRTSQKMTKSCIP
jgi:hypothetical protein